MRKLYSNANGANRFLPLPPNESLDSSSLEYILYEWRRCMPYTTNWHIIANGLCFVAKKGFTVSRNARGPRYHRRSGTLQKLSNDFCSFKSQKLITNLSCFDILRRRPYTTQRHIQMTAMQYTSVVIAKETSGSVRIIHAK